MPGMSDFLNELKEKAFAGFDIVTVAEAAGVNYPNLSEFIGETGYFDMIFDFKWADLDVKSGSEWFYRIDWSWNDLRTLIFKQQKPCKRLVGVQILLKIMINLERQRNI